MNKLVNYLKEEILCKDVIIVTKTKSDLINPLMEAMLTKIKNKYKGRFKYFSLDINLLEKLNIEHSNCVPELIILKDGYKVSSIIGFRQNKQYVQLIDKCINM